VATSGQAYTPRRHSPKRPRFDPTPRLANLRDARRFDDGGSFLPRGKARGLCMIGIHSRELLAVAIEYRDLPVTMLTPFVFSERGTLFLCLQSVFLVEGALAISQFLIAIASPFHKKNFETARSLFNSFRNVSISSCQY
jgi:hypothetical protein